MLDPRVDPAARDNYAIQSASYNGHKEIVKMLLIAPEFSDDFVTDCEMDTEMNLSLITASTLLNIFDFFKSNKLG